MVGLHLLDAESTWLPKIYPVTAGFALETTGALGKTAILADYDRGLEGVALCEMFFGGGRLFCPRLIWSIAPDGSRG